MGGFFCRFYRIFWGGVRILQSTPLTQAVSGVLCVYLHALFNITLILYICSLTQHLLRSVNIVYECEDIINCKHEPNVFAFI